MPAKAKFSIFSELGTSGVPELGGISADRYAESLRGPAGVFKLARVLRREPAAFTAWNMATLAAQPVRWYVTPAADAKADQECADFIQSVLVDMSHSMLSAVQFSMSAWAFGFADQEICWKKRLGQAPGKDLPSSRWDDGRIGVRKLAIRRQETVAKWIFDPQGNKSALQQIDPATGKTMPDIPIEKLLHFVGGADRGSWEGLGFLEPAYWMAYLVEQLEQIGGATAQRGGTGIPVFNFLAPPDDATKTAVDEIGEGLAANELQYVKLPGPMVQFDLKTVSLSNLGDIRGWIDQLRWEISALLMATFVRLGSTERGTQALGGTMYDAFTMGIDGCLDGIADTLNRYLVPRLLANNPGEFKGISDHPKITHTKVTKLPPATAQYLDKLTAWLDAAESADVEWLRSLFDMPYRSAADIEAAREEKRKAEEAAAAKAAKELEKQAKAGVLPPGTPGVTPPQLAQSAQAAAQVAGANVPQQQEQPGPKAEAGTKQPETEATKLAEDLGVPISAQYPAAVREALLTAALRIVAGRETAADLELAAQLDPLPQNAAEWADLLNTAHMPPGSAKGGQFAPKGTSGAVEVESTGLLQRGETTKLTGWLTEQGGFTYQPKADYAPTDGFMVSPYKDAEKIIPEGKVTTRTISRYVRSQRERLRQDDNFLGAWVDGGKVYLDVSVRRPTREAALQLAKEHGQLAFFDLQNMETVYAN
jgi:hypothetical protein